MTWRRETELERERMQRGETQLAIERPNDRESWREALDKEKGAADNKLCLPLLCTCIKTRCVTCSSKLCGIYTHSWLSRGRYGARMPKELLQPLLPFFPGHRYVHVDPDLVEPPDNQISVNGE